MQLLNLTQNIEDGFERCVLTCTVFVNLSAAYDIISHKLRRNKIFRMTSDVKFADLIENMFSNRRYTLLNWTIKTQKEELVEWSSTRKCVQV